VDERAHPEARRPAVEWVFGIVSAAVVAGLLLMLAYQALFGAARPPELSISIERIDRLDRGVLVAIAVANGGDMAASAVRAHASAPDASGAVVRKRIEFDYVAAHAVRRGAFVFSGPVAAEDVSVEIDGFTEP